MTPEQLAAEVTSMLPRSANDLIIVTTPGVYAWWDCDGAVPWPAGHPPVDVFAPLYVGIAARQSLGQRTAGNHLASTRRSALRRSLAAVLADHLELSPAQVIAYPKGKFGLDAPAESGLTTWILKHLTVTWVETSDPEPVEQHLVATLHPPLNDRGAAASPHRAPMRTLRSALRTTAGG